MEAVVYNKKGKEVSKISLPDKVFSVKWNADLVHQVVTSMQANARTPVAHAKDRGEISGGGKKPWKQKGTGRARHGSTRSPIWVGGGSAHGPRNEKDYSRKINQKMRVKALNTVLSAKLRDGEIIFIDSFDFSAPKTKEAKDILTNLSSIKGFEKILSKKKNSAFIATGENNKNTKKSFSNIGSISLDEIKNINPVSVLGHKYLIIENPEKSLATLLFRVEKK
jgi:large subunit ribosomal protein L4